jgi:hypothetical protein
LTYVAAQADGEVKEAAERMAREQLDHVSVLRQMRLAFHSNRRAAKAESVTLARWPPPNAASLFLSSNMTAERQTTRFFDDMLRHHAKPPKSSTRLKTITHQRLSIIALPAERREDPVALCEYPAEAYLHLAEISRNERVLAAARSRDRRHRSVGGDAIENVGLRSPIFALEPARSRGLVPGCEGAPRPKINHRLWTVLPLTCDPPPTY